MLQLFKKCIFNGYIPIYNEKMFSSNNTSYFTKRHYETISYNNPKGNRHFPPANKEWYNSVYTYNKEHLKNTVVKDQIVNELINAHFNLDRYTYKNKINVSKRMRDLRKRYSTKRIFVSKPEIKQANNKTSITVYAYNRQKHLIAKKALLSQMWMEKNFYPANLFLFKSADNSKFNISKHHDKKKVFKHRYLRKLTYNYNINFNTHISKIISSLLLKKNFLYNKFFFLFLKWALTLFKIRIFNPNIEKLNELIRSNKQNKNILISKLKKQSKLKISTKSKKTLITNKINKLEKSINMLKKNVMFTLVINNFTFDKKFINNYKHINNFLFKYLLFNIKNRRINSYNRRKINIKSFIKTSNLFVKPNLELSIYEKNKINLLFRNFKIKYMNKYINDFLRKELFQIKILLKLYDNNYKYNLLLTKLKSILKKVYNNKYIELNIVDLKYLHLNADIFLQAISVKLKKKRIRLLTTIKRSMKLVKIPKLIDQYLQVRDNSKKVLSNLIIYRGAYAYNNNTKYNKDSLSLLIKNLFNNSVKQIKNINDEYYVISNKKIFKYPWYNSFYNSLLSIKYKWITGTKLETKGRLTKRYTASRALVKHKTKGSLKSLEFLNYNDVIKPDSIAVLRNNLKPNLQYSHTSHVRRIGVFGLKTWISSY